MLLRGIILMLQGLMFICTQTFEAPSNCVRAGGGTSGPLHDFCIGCNFHSALKCISDMRSNSSGNVPSNCQMSALTLTPQPTCCPKYARRSKKSIIQSTAAYVDTLSCLSEAGCANSTYHTSIANECIFQGCEDEFDSCSMVASAFELLPWSLLIWSMLFSYTIILL